MQGFRAIGRYFRDASKSVIRNFSLSIASISCITITLIVVAASIIISFNVENFADSIRKDVTVVIFLKSDVDETEREKLKDIIEKTKNVANLTFKSKEETAEETKESIPVLENLIEEWKENDSNPLLDSYLLKVKDIEQIRETVAQIKKSEYVNNINYGDEIVDQLITVFKIVEKISIGVVVALIIVTAFLITNTIKLAIFSRKREIEIMRLVGASNLSIKIPFIIEGLFIGSLGAIIPIIITIYGYSSLYNFFGGKLFGSSLARLISPMPFVYYSSLLLILIGIIVGMFGSYTAVKKYLKI